MSYAYAVLIALAAGAGSYVLLRRLFRAPQGPRVLPQKEITSSGRLAVLTQRLVRTTNLVIPQSASDATALRKRLAHAGVNVSPSTYHGVVVLFWATLACLLALTMPLLGANTPLALFACVGLAIVALILPRTLLAILARKRADQIRATLPRALDLLSVGVEAGLTMERAMRLFAQKDRSALAREFDLVGLDMNTLGFSRADALQRMSDRCKVDDLSLFVAAVNASAVSGSPIADVLRHQSEAAFERRRQHFEEMGNKLQSKMIIPMGLFLVPAMLIAAIGPMIINIATNASRVM